MLQFAVEMSREGLTEKVTSEQNLKRDGEQGMWGQAGAEDGRQEDSKDPEAGMCLDV